MTFFLLSLLAILIFVCLLRWVIENVRCPYCNKEKVVPLPTGALQWHCLSCKKDFTLGQ